MTTSARFTRWEIECLLRVARVSAQTGDSDALREAAATRAYVWRKAWARGIWEAWRASGWPKASSLKRNGSASGIRT